MTASGGRGRVFLVGAGPGAPELVTLRGAEVLRRAEVVLYDELAPEELLALAPPSAERIDVGKRGHDASARSQEDINALLVERAQRGLRVVRLKGGDPFVFGRGGEEASACRAAAVAFEVVPGVSSAIAVPAYAGIPLTDRRYAASFAVVTGHMNPSKPENATRWRELARAVDTLVILMGMRTLPAIVDELLAGGRSPATPAAAIMDGTLGRQRKVVATLAELPARIEAAGLGAPAVIVVGEVAGLEESLGWWEDSPLFGLRVLVTRAREQAGELASALRALGAEPVVAPMIRLEPPESWAELDAALDDLVAGGERGFAAIALTSANAVRFLVQRARERAIDIASCDVRLLCAGPQTANAVLAEGLAVHLVPGSAAGSGDAESFLAEISRALPVAGQRFLLPRSAIGREVLEAGLGSLGAEVVAVTAYRTLPPAGDGGALSARVASGEIQALTFTSPSTVRNLLATLDTAACEALSSRLLAAVGPTTAGAMRKQGLEPEVVAERAGVASLAQAIEAHLSDHPERLAELRALGDGRDGR